MDRPGCYGEYWEGVPGSECFADGTCKEIDGCLASFATGKLVEYQKTLGPKATAQKLSEAAQVKPEAILLAINYQKEQGFDPFDVPPPAKDEKVVDPPSPDAANKEPAKKEPAKKKKRPPAKKKAASKKKAEIANPKMTAPAKAAKEPVKAVEKKGQTSAGVVKAQGSKDWGDQHDKNRWERERKRSPLIAQLTPGMKLTRDWKGEDIVVIVRKGYYQFQEKKYPTLYSITKLVTGTHEAQCQKRADGSRPDGTRHLTNWSAAKFFRLAWLFQKKKPKWRKGK